MRPADSHLTPQELELVRFAGTGPAITSVDGAQAQEAQRHLENCEYCRSVAAQYSSINLTLGRLRAGPAPTRRDDCPEESVWLELAAGLVDGSRLSELTDHAARCDYCGMHLREAAEDATTLPTEEVEAVVASLGTAQPDRQRAVATSLAGTPFAEERQPDQKAGAGQRQIEKARFPWLSRLVWAGGAIAVAAVAVLLGVRMLRQPDPNELLAKAYTQKRTIELRFPGAAYGPIRVERGIGNQDQPTEFYEAEVIIKRESQKHAEDPNWLQAQAQAQLLQWDYESAIRNIEDALMLKPDDPALLQTKAMAYFERAEKLGPEGAIDYGEAAEDLSKALKKTPDDPVALFNRAIVYDKIHLPNEAIDDLEHYLRIDPTGPWSAEAKDRLDRLKKMVKAHQDALAEPLADPATFLRLMGDPAAVAHIDERIEDYQDLAVKDWLPRAFPVGGQTAESPVAFSALRALAEILQERHQDKWLNDLLDESSSSPVFAKAVKALRDGYAQSIAGSSLVALSLLKRASRLFEEGNNDAGRLRSEEEQMHAIRNAQQGSLCLTIFREFNDRAAALGYQWVSIQADVDRQSCMLMQSRFESAPLVTEAAKKAHYPLLALRSLGISASVETDQGNMRAAWREDGKGLKEYWDTPGIAPRRAQQFYDDLTYSAESAGAWHLAATLGAESVRMSALAGDRKLEALTRQHLAKILIENKDLGPAAAELRKSQALLNSLALTGSLEGSRVYAEIGLAEIDLLMGKPGAAQDRLNSVRGSIEQVHSFTVSRAFFTTSGDLMAREGNSAAAEESLLHAVAIATAASHQLKTATAKKQWAEENKPTFRSLVELEIAKGDTNAALAVAEWYRCASYRFPQTTLSLATWRDEISNTPPRSAGEAVIAYFSLSDGLGVWVFNDAGISFKRVAVDPQYVNELAAHFRKLCSDPESTLEQIRNTGSKLYDLLIAPISVKIGAASMLVVEPDESLSGVPFEALYTPDERYLGEKTQIVVSPGLIYQQKLRDPRILSSNSTALVVAATAVNSQSLKLLGPTTGVLQEAEDIAAQFTNARLLVGQDATAESLDAALPKAEILHVAGHGLSTPTTTGVLLDSEQQGGREPAIWNASEINKLLFRKCQLVVLSACSTAAGPWTSGRQADGELVQTILAAGVPFVVGSRWNVDSRITARFMHKFYSAVVSGHSVESAVASAEATLRQRPETCHPYYWAAFGVFGGT